TIAKVRERLKRGTATLDDVDGTTQPDVIVREFVRHKNERTGRWGAWHKTPIYVIPVWFIGEPVEPKPLVLMQDDYDRLRDMSRDKKEEVWKVLQSIWAEHYGTKKLPRNWIELFGKLVRTGPLSSTIL